MSKYDLIGFGNPLLDFTLEVSDSFLKELNFEKGKMYLVSKEESQKILDKIKDFQLKISPGGSSANTIAGVACLGGKCAFIGKVGNDLNGELYESRTREEGVFTILLKDNNEITGNAIVFITPDFERTFAVHLGASIFFRKKDIPEDELKNSGILHLEAYQLEDPELMKAILHAVAIAKENNAKISLDMSDSSLIKRNLDLFRNFIEKNVDIVFANESEAEALTGKKTEQALEEISRMCELVIVKLGEKGSLIKKGKEVYRIPAYKANIINTNGAGDMYAAGILYSISKNLDLENAGKIASYAASLVVGKEGARFGKELKQEIINFCVNNSIIIE